MYQLTQELYFPPVNQTDAQGVIAIGGDLSVERLLLAYKNGIFPWYNDNQPILWWCPNYRMVLFPDQFKPSKSMRNILNQNKYQVTFNQCFTQVMQNCQQIKRVDQNDTWINNNMIQAYTQLHKQQKSLSVEVWQNNELVGGLYGVDMYPVFCGESMFSKSNNASKVAFVYLVNYLKSKHYTLLDCQVYNDHLASLGCYEIPRETFLEILKSSSA